MTFWEDLPKPIVALAPMADVTDPAFRRIIAKYGKPDVLWTEFVSADGLFLGGYDALVKDLEHFQGCCIAIESSSIGASDSSPGRQSWGTGNESRPAP